MRIAGRVDVNRSAARFDAPQYRCEHRSMLCNTLVMCARRPGRRWPAPSASANCCAAVRATQRAPASTDARIVIYDVFSMFVGARAARGRAAWGGEGARVPCPFGARGGSLPSSQACGRASAAAAAHPAATPAAWGIKKGCDSYVTFGASMGALRTHFPPAWDSLASSCTVFPPKCKWGSPGTTRGRVEKMNRSFGRSLSFRRTSIDEIHLWISKAVSDTRCKRV
jgi:hypothetical protein